jgi:hypothetical protein
MQYQGASIAVLPDLTGQGTDNGNDDDDRPILSEEAHGTSIAKVSLQVAQL